MALQNHKLAKPSFYHLGRTRKIIPPSIVQEEGRWNPSVADPDLQIRGGGGGGHPDPEISRGAQSPKKFFRLFGPHFDRKIKGGGPLGPLPWIHHCPSPQFLICCSISKRFCLHWKAFDLLNKMRYILWMVALLETCDVTNNGRHLGFYQELEFRLKQREMVIAWPF